jgi:hypothetical protein
MLEELERLNDAVVLKLERAGPDTTKRYAEELVPRLEQARELTARGTARARNACEDALTAFREVAFTANATITKAVF